MKAALSMADVVPYIAKAQKLHKQVMSSPHTRNAIRGGLKGMLPGMIGGGLSGLQGQDPETLQADQIVSTPDRVLKNTLLGKLSGGLGGAIGGAASGYLGGNVDTGGRTGGAVAGYLGGHVLNEKKKLKNKKMTLDKHLAVREDIEKQKENPPSLASDMLRGGLGGAAIGAVVNNPYVKLPPVNMRGLASRIAGKGSGRGAIIGGVAGAATGALRNVLLRHFDVKKPDTAKIEVKKEPESKKEKP
jgi:hypothetical protein